MNIDHDMIRLHCSRAILRFPNKQKKKTLNSLFVVYATCTIKVTVTIYAHSTTSSQLINNYNQARYVCATKHLSTYLAHSSKWLLVTYVKIDVRCWTYILLFPDFDVCRKGNGSKPQTADTSRVDGHILTPAASHHQHTIQALRQYFKEVHVFVRN